MNDKVFSLPRSERESFYCRGKIKVWIIIIFLVIAGIFAWGYFDIFESEKTEAPEIKILEAPEKEKEEPVKLTLAAIKNAEYYFPLYERKVRLIAGQHEEEEVVDEGGFRYFFSAGIIEDKLAFGDLNYNGKEDAAVIVYSTGGGSGVFYELAVMMNQEGSPYHITSEYLGDRIKVNSVNIKEGVIILDMLIHDVDDAACCPTLYKIFQYKLFGNELLEI